jgi:hypothetical protein
MKTLSNLQKHMIVLNTITYSVTVFIVVKVYLISTIDVLSSGNIFAAQASVSSNYRIISIIMFIVFIVYALNIRHLLHKYNITDVRLMLIKNLLTMFVVFVVFLIMVYSLHEQNLRLIIVTHINYE